MWLGMHSGAKEYAVPDRYVGKISRVDDDGTRYVKMGNTAWFTNLDIPKRHEDLILYKEYTPEAYPKYDNYDAIEVCPTAHIPQDYPGAMGVPISFLDKHNPDQFEILGMDRPLLKELTGRQSRFFLNGNEIYARIVIRNKITETQ